MKTVIAAQSADCGAVMDDTFFSSNKNFRGRMRLYKAID